MVRRLLRWAALALAGFASAAAAQEKAAPPVAGAPLRVASWGGAYQAAQADIIFKPFTDRTGVAVLPIVQSGGVEELKAAASETPPAFSVVDLTAEDAAQACAAGLLVALDRDGFARGADDSAPASDFIVDFPCGVAATLTSEVIIYDRAVFSARAPQKLSDFFDLEAFPGKRGLKRDAMGTLELALLADHVPPTDVYARLATEEGMAQAFAKLDSIRDSIIWWERGDSPAAFVGRRDAVMSTAFNTRAYLAAVNGADIAVVWDRALVYANGWGILRTAPDPGVALEFVKFATDAVRLSALAEAMPYGPARRSALSGVSPEMRAFSPSAAEHLAHALLIDPEFWRVHGAALRGRFAIWAAQQDKGRAQAAARANR